MTRSALGFFSRSYPGIPRGVSTCIKVVQSRYDCRLAGNCHSLLFFDTEEIVRKFRSFEKANYARSEHFELAVIVGYSLSLSKGIRWHPSQTALNLRI